MSKAIDWLLEEDAEQVGDAAGDARAARRADGGVIRAEPLPWLLEAENPSARYLALTRLLGCSPDEPRAAEAQAAIPHAMPARAILEAQWSEGYWMGPGIGYSPKFKATTWQVIFLAALGAPRSESTDRACAYVLAHSRLPDGRFSAYKSAKGAVACLNGNLLRAMLQLGSEDRRVDESLEVLAEMVARDRFRCRFNAPSPPPARMRDGFPCAWGAIKVLGAFAEVPEEERPAGARAAIELGLDFLLNGDLASGGYPAPTGPSPLWRRFGFPLGFGSDLLEALEVLGRLGAEQDARLSAAVEVVQGKRDEAGRWRLEQTPDNTWASFGREGQPNKWVTLRALQALKGWETGPDRLGSTLPTAAAPSRRGCPGLRDGERCAGRSHGGRSCDRRWLRQRCTCPWPWTER
jgi:hypothetical protein